MIAAHLPHIAQISEWDVRKGLPIRRFFTMHDICTTLIENRRGLYRVDSNSKRSAEVSDNGIPEIFSYF